MPATWRCLSIKVRFETKLLTKSSRTMSSLQQSQEGITGVQSRRGFLTSAAATLAYCGAVKPLQAFEGNGHSKFQRTVVVMFDGFGPGYLEQSDVPTLRRWQRDGLFKQVKGMVPAVTNTNNSSICCGVFPREPTTNQVDVRVTDLSSATVTFEKPSPPKKRVRSWLLFTRPEPEHWERSGAARPGRRI